MCSTCARDDQIQHMDEQVTLQKSSSNFVTLTFSCSDEWNSMCGKIKCDTLYTRVEDTKFNDLSHDSKTRDSKSCTVILCCTSTGTVWAQVCCSFQKIYPKSSHPLLAPWYFPRIVLHYHRAGTYIGRILIPFIRLCHVWVHINSDVWCISRVGIAFHLVGCVWLWQVIVHPDYGKCLCVHINSDVWCVWLWRVIVHPDYGKCRYAYVHIHLYVHIYVYLYIYISIYTYMYIYL